MSKLENTFLWKKSKSGTTNSYTKAEVDALLTNYESKDSLKLKKLILGTDYVVSSNVGGNKVDYYGFTKNVFEYKELVFKFFSSTGNTNNYSLQLIYLNINNSDWRQDAINWNGNNNFLVISAVFSVGVAKRIIINRDNNSSSTGQIVEIWGR